MTTNALKACLNQQEDWYRALDPIAFSFRGSKHCSTHRTPFEMMFGHQMLLPVELCTKQLLLQKQHNVNNFQEDESSYPLQEEILEVMMDIREKIHNVAAKNISKAQAHQAKNYNLRHKGETLKVSDKIMKKNKKAEQRKGDKLGPRWLGPYLITDVHKNGNYTVADPKTGKVLATRCLQSECKLYIDLVLGTTEKEYQDTLDEAKKLEPQHPEHLASLESSEDITSSQSSEDFTTSSQSSDDLKSLDGLMASHSLGDKEDEDDQEEEEV